MPDERAAFLSALREQPDDVTTPLVFADWLEEHGDAGDVELAAFIRLEIRCDALDPDDLSEAARSQRDRHHKALLAQKDVLCRRLGLPEGSTWAVKCGFRRGLLESLSIPVQWLLDGAEALAREAPLLRGLAVGRVNGWGERLADLSLLRQITELN